MNKKPNLSSLDNCSIIELCEHNHEKDSICMFSSKNSIPFDIKRIYYIYDIPNTVTRGAHAHRNTIQVIIAAKGSFNVTLTDGEKKRIVTLNNIHKGLLIEPGIWKELSNFSSDSICLVLVSELYDENDYIRDYETFLKTKQI